jgi:DNA-directed RNA polymerase specialized sigma24 family protein
MAQILQALNKEWAAIADSPAARRALMRWSAMHPVLLPASDLNDVIDLGYRPDIGPDVRLALATLAPADHLAARTLLQELIGGLVKLARRVGRDDDAVDDVVSLAWERIRTYPVHRPGSVSGNVLLDVRKRYRRDHDTPRRCLASLGDAALEPSAEDRVLGNAFLGELIAASEGSGVSHDVLSTIIRSRVGGESMADLAAEQHVSRKVLWHRRWRAEARLRELPLAS